MGRLLKDRTGGPSTTALKFRDCTQWVFPVDDQGHEAMDTACEFFHSEAGD